MTAPRALAAGAPCPCGSGDAFEACCGPVLHGEPAATAQALMRSRYTAFALGDAAHLAASWHPGTRPGDLDIDIDPGLQWTGLKIIDVVDGAEGDKRGVVEFQARWRQGRETGELHERSRFVRQSGLWWYLDGAVR
ncbi:YchJ family metal-binding protein [Microbacterium sp. W1N]|uniref:YchJ family protein n=1 Tax=Microbacterium festucae TaxID=2977531 RepID=UPI0021C10CCD|nr:YchJ family metal-binding protein [Microbacterium festucae]MCT9819939.1 YchJ family metal-binding protein [Microbacterium festucae]